MSDGICLCEHFMKNGFLPTVTVENFFWKKKMFEAFPSFLPHPFPSFSKY